MVYVDNFYETVAGNFGGIKRSRMVADTRNELLDMCDKIGIEHKWIKDSGTVREHFAVSMTRRKKAIEAGAEAINCRELYEITDKRIMEQYNL